MPILLYLNALLIPVFPVFNYIVNTEIYEVLCINKDKPKIDCHGKCQLADELEEIKNEAEDFPNLEINLKDYPIGFVDFVFLKEPFYKDILENIFYSFDYKFLLEFDIFHPPISLN